MSERLRILHCMRAPVGGLFRHVLDLGAEQAARGLLGAQIQDVPKQPADRGAHTMQNAQALTHARQTPRSGFQKLKEAFEHVDGIARE